MASETFTDFLRRQQAEQGKATASASRARDEWIDDLNQLLDLASTSWRAGFATSRRTNSYG